MIICTLASIDQSERDTMINLLEIMWSYEVQQFNKLMLNGTTVAVLSRTPSYQTDYDRAFNIALECGTVYKGIPAYVLDGIEKWVD